MSAYNLCINYTGLPVNDRKEYVELGKLVSGTALQTVDQTGDDCSDEHSEGKFDVYSIEVEGPHNYFVSDQKALVHNKAAVNKSVVRELRSLEKNVAEHKQKLADYLRNPDKYDNQGHLRNTGSNMALRQKIIDARVKHLRKEIGNWEKRINEINRLLGGQ